ncbi:MAG: (Fe-S)-binding protein [Actinomycetia bacterium]|nr:(Fe-S)-binding protein [Actinomycetes bacterium]
MASEAPLAGPFDSAHCVHCGLCVPSCPTFVVTGLESESPRGRVWLLERLAAGDIPADPDAVRYIDDCLDCRACEEVCPAHVPVGHYVERFRAAHPEWLSRGERDTARWVDRFLGSEAGLRAFGAAARFSRTPAGGWMVRQATRLVPGLPTGALDLAQGLPDEQAGGLSRDRIRTRPAGTGDGPVVMQFLGCVMDSVFAATNVRTHDVLRAAGFRVVAPAAQRCCGALSVHTGDPAPARAWAKANIEAFEASEAEAVAVNAAGCGAALKEYPDLLREEGPAWVARAERFARAVRDVSELLEAGSFPVLPPRAETVTMHDACHLAHAQGIRQPPRALLERAGYRLVEMPDADRCCGSAGVYNLTHPEMARALQALKVADIPETADVVATGNPGCQLQIQAGLRRAGRSVPVRHTVDLLWQALADAGRLPEDVREEAGRRGT